MSTQATGTPRIQCNTCHHRCELEEGQTGFCGVRQNQGGTITAINYGLVTALALDPIEKKPLARFHPGSKILSVGSYGCNLACPFCQNYSISKEFPALQRPASQNAAPQSNTTRAAQSTVPAQSNTAPQSSAAANAERTTPEELLQTALELVPRGNIGIAFTYNEPLVSWEFVRDTARLFHGRGLKTVLVTNGSVLPAVLEAVLPYIDALNIDVKAFTQSGYQKLGGDLDTVKAAVETSAARAHVELTTLIVPGLNDSPEEMREEAAWIREVEKACGKDIPLHVTRFFPRYKMEGAQPTPVSTVFQLADVACKYLAYVYTGNV